MNRGAFMQFEI